MQPSDHLDGQRPAPIQDLGDARSATEIRFQIAPRQPAALHVIEQGIDRIGRLDWFVQRLVALDVKRYNGSNVISHLFAQGMVSAEAFRSEPQFRKDALDLLPDRFRWKAEPPSPADFRVVFAVVRDGAGSLSLPFFSRVNLRQAVKRLGAYGYHVALARIELDPLFAQTKKFIQEDVRLPRHSVRD